MKLNITSARGNSFLTNIANAIGSTVEDGVVKIPNELGCGSIRGYVITENLRIMIRQYELKNDLNFKITPAKHNTEAVMIAFHNVFRIKDEKSSSLTESSEGIKLLPHVQIASGGISAEFFIPAKTKMNSIIIGIDVSYLKDLLNHCAENTLLQAITSTKLPYLFEEIISPKIQDVAHEIVNTDLPSNLRLFFLKVKAEEMIYLLFLELFKREDRNVQSLNIADVAAIYKVKEEILSNINTPPNLSELAIFAGMSPSKLGRLFNQIFGNSMYQYYQIYRMKEATYLLKESNLSVSEVGYRLGFSNLSHFSKTFEDHVGVKPKKYKMA